jgi:hypothetical protein
MKQNAMRNFSHVLGVISREITRPASTLSVPPIFSTPCPSQHINHVSPSEWQISRLCAAKVECGDHLVAALCG